MAKECNSTTCTKEDCAGCSHSQKNPQNHRGRGELRHNLVRGDEGFEMVGGLIHKYSGIPHVWHLREFGDLDFNMHPLMPKKKCGKFMASLNRK